MTTSPRELCKSVVEVAQEAGKLLLREVPLGKWRGDVEDKGHGELVTRVDRESEALIRELVLERHPDHVVLGEEYGQHDSDPHPYRWIVDPLDGTTNFVHGHPFFAVSIAVQRAHDGVVVASAVHAPRLGETFFAALGEGAFLNTWSTSLRTSDTAALRDAVVASGFAYDRERYPNFDNFTRIAKQTRGIRRCGSAALDLAFVACGRYDGFWELGLRIWDVAAGALLVREAGGVVTDFLGGDQWLESGNIIAGNPHIGSAIRSDLDPAKHLST